jgi:phosphomannomutase / phosphoglucomutase
MSIADSIVRQYDIRGIVGVDLHAETARLVGRGLAALLDERGIAGSVVVGRDNRPSGGELGAALIAGLSSGGRAVVDIGVVPTPLVYWGLHHLDVVAGVQVTGSHNPAEYNGFKISVGTGSLHGEGLVRLRDLALSGPAPAGRAGLVSTRSDVITRYLDDIAGRVGRLERAIDVVVDCGNGAGSLVAPELLERIGARATLLYCENDGTFPNHHPDPTVPENLLDMIEAVREGSAELGIAFDGDADRIGVVDDTGEIIWGDRLLIVYARDVLERTGRGQSIIFDVKCSQSLADAIETAGGKAVMWKTGHSLIKEKMKETGAPLAGEMSGHMFFGEGFYGHDDALYAAARLLSILARKGQSVRELLSDVPPSVVTPEIRIDCPDDTKFGIVADAVRHYSGLHDVIDVDGVRVIFDGGWGLIRASNTQPVIVARYEAESEERLREIRSEMEGWLRDRGVEV